MKNLIRYTLNTLKNAVLVSLVLMLICGFIYPVVTTQVAGLLFPVQAKGNLVEVNGKAVGSKFVGQEFTEDYYLWGRPSAHHYNTYVEDRQGNKFYSDGTEFQGLASGSENYAVSNPKLKERVAKEVTRVTEANPTVSADRIPMDLVTSSGSGLDPHISPDAAELQVARIAANSGLSEEKIRNIIQKNTEDKLLGVFGEETVNVLLVNIDIARELQEI